MNAATTPKIRMYRNKPERMEIEGYLVCWKATGYGYGVPLVYERQSLGPFEFLVRVYEGSYEEIYNVERYSEGSLHRWFERAVADYKAKLEREAASKASTARRFQKRFWYSS